MSATVSQWILDSGASGYISDGRRDIAGRRRKHDGSTVLVTSRGPTPVREETDVSVPGLAHVTGKTGAIVSERSPNLAPLGHLIMQDHFSLVWNYKDGFVFRDPKGRVVQTYLDHQHLPRLGEWPLEEKALAAFWDDYDAKQDDWPKVAKAVVARLQRAGVIPPLTTSKGANPSTATQLIGGRLYACMEVNCPFRVHVDPETGRVCVRPRPREHGVPKHCRDTRAYNTMSHPNLGVVWTHVFLH